MKKLAALVVSVILVISMTACGSKDEPNNAGSQPPQQSATPESSPEATPEATPENSVPSVQELIEKSSEAAVALNSFVIEIDMDQNFVADKEEQKMKMVTTTEFVRDPLAMYQVISTSMSGEGEQKMAQYITKDGIYAEVDGSWMKFPASFKDELVAELEDSMQPEKQYENFKQIANETKVLVEGNDYILSADISGSNINELARTFLSQNGGDNSELEEMLEMMTITKLNVKSGVNKETYMPTISDVIMSAEMEIEGQKLSVDMTIKSKISKYNEVKDIVVPAEALNAEEIDL